MFVQSIVSAAVPAATIGLASECMSAVMLSDVDVDVTFTSALLELASSWKP